MQAQHMALLVMVARSVLVLGKTAQHAVWVVVMVQAEVLCPTLAAARESTFRKPLTSTLGVVGTLMWSGQEEISLASSQAAVF